MCFVKQVEVFISGESKGDKLHCSFFSNLSSKYGTPICQSQRPMQSLILFLFFKIMIVNLHIYLCFDVNYGNVLLLLVWS